MFCGKCGAQNEDNATFCSKCGAQFTKQSGNMLGGVTSEASAEKRKNQKIGIIFIAVVLVVGIVLLTNLFGGRSYKATIDTFVDGTMSVDAEKILKLFPPKMVDYLLEEEGYDKEDKKYLIEEANKSLQETMDYLEEYVGGKFKISYEIGEVEDVTGLEFKEKRDFYDEYDVKVSQAKEVEVEIIVTYKDTEKSNTTYLPLIKIGNSWYIDASEFSYYF